MFSRKITTFFNYSSERKSSTTHQNAITASKSEFWYGTPISLKEEPRHSITTENIHKKVRPKSALISASAAEVQNKISVPKIEGYKRPVVEHGLVKQRAKVRNLKGLYSYVYSLDPLLPLTL